MAAGPINARTVFNSKTRGESLVDRAAVDSGLVDALTIVAVARDEDACVYEGVVSVDQIPHFFFHARTYGKVLTIEAVVEVVVVDDVDIPLLTVDILEHWDEGGAGCGSGVAASPWWKVEPP